MEERELYTVLQQVHEADVEDAKKITEVYRENRKNCPTLPRIGVLVYKPSTQTAEEKLHADNCLLCQKTLHDMKLDAYHPTSRSIIRYFKNKLNDSEREDVQWHLEAIQCDECMRLVESMKKAGKITKD